jgi:hypothetical protein
MELHSVQAQALVGGVQLHLPEIKPRPPVSREIAPRTLGELVRPLSRDVACRISEKPPEFTLLHVDRRTGVEAGRSWV